MEGTAGITICIWQERPAAFTFVHLKRGDADLGFPDLFSLYQLGTAMQLRAVEEPLFGAWPGMSNCLVAQPGNQWAIALRNGGAIDGSTSQSVRRNITCMWRLARGRRLRLHWIVSHGCGFAVVGPCYARLCPGEQIKANKSIKQRSSTGHYLESSV